jgi:hypothetical protein
MALVMLQTKCPDMWIDAHLHKTSAPASTSSQRFWTTSILLTPISPIFFIPLWLRFSIPDPWNRNYRSIDRDISNQGAQAPVVVYNKKVGWIWQLSAAIGLFGRTSCPSTDHHGWLALKCGNYGAQAPIIVPKESRWIRQRSVFPEGSRTFGLEMLHGCLDPLNRNYVSVYRNICNYGA